MRAGTMDRRITLQHRSLTPDAHGQKVVGYITYAEVWAQRLDVTARERLASQQVIAESSCRFRLRYRNDVVATDRVLCEGVTYNITPPTEIGRREGIEILASAVVP